MKSLKHENFEASATVQPRSRGFPAGFLDRTFYARVPDAPVTEPVSTGFMSKALAVMRPDTKLLFRVLLYSLVWFLGSYGCES